MGHGHPRHQLDDPLTHGVRFSIVVALDGVDRAEFALVRDSVEISDSVVGAPRSPDTSRPCRPSRAGAEPAPTTPSIMPE